jgi:hypothetical protein
LEQNNNNQEEKDKLESKDKKSKAVKYSEYAQIYAVVTQGFLMMIVVAGIGYLIGH